MAYIIAFVVNIILILSLKFCHSTWNEKIRCKLCLTGQTPLWSKRSGSFCLCNNFAAISVSLSSNQGETSEQRRWLWSWGSLWILLWRWQFFLWFPQRPLSPNKSTVITYSSFYVVFDELLKDTGNGLHIILSKYPKILHCNWLGDCLVEVKYNKISQLGIILNGGQNRLKRWLLKRGPTYSK